MKYNFYKRDFNRLEKTVKVIAQLDPKNKNYDFMIKYMKYRMFTQAVIDQREKDQRYTEGDLSSILFKFDDPKKAKTLSFASMVFAKEISKNPDVAKDCELKGMGFHIFGFFFVIYTRYCLEDEHCHCPFNF